LVASGAPPSLLAYIVPSASKCQHGIFDFLELFSLAIKSRRRAPLKPQLLPTSTSVILCLRTPHCHQPAVNRRNNECLLVKPRYGLRQSPFQGVFVNRRTNFRFRMSFGEQRTWFSGKSLSRACITCTGHRRRGASTSADHFIRGADGDKRYLSGEPLPG
jgi:hypothetical protein